MRRVPLCVAVALLPFLAIGAQTPPRAKLAASITRVFGQGARVDSLHVDSNTVLRISRRDSLLGFAEVGNVIGKSEPITFLVAIGPDDRLKDVDILVYREPRGGEVAYEAWRKQFRGKTAADSVRGGKGIRSISGATISVHAVTAGVRRMLGDLTAWHRAGTIR
jgi:transcriptional regulator of nitric oxide reductase